MQDKSETTRTDGLMPFENQDAYKKAAEKLLLSKMTRDPVIISIE